MAEILVNEVQMAYIAEVRKLKERIKALENYLRRRFIATCPDVYCKKDCQNCPEVDKWIEQVVKGGK